MEPRSVFNPSPKSAGYSCFPDNNLDWTMWSGSKPSPQPGNPGPLLTLETVKEWHRKRQSPNGIMRDRWDHNKEIITEISQWPRSQSRDSKLAFNKRIIGSPLPKAPAEMFTKRLTELDVEQPNLMVISLLCRCGRSMMVTTDMHRVRATGCKRYQGWPTKLCMRVWRAQMPLNIHGMNDHLMRTLRDRYEVISDWPSPTDMRPNAEASKAATMITEGLSLRSLRGIERAWVLVHWNVCWVWPVTGMLTNYICQCNRTWRW
jgi:hypothetical protein